MNPAAQTVTTIGKTALERLSHDQAATVIGVTSKGVFLRLVADRIVFISAEHYRGPLTINANGQTGWLDLCRPGDSLAVQAGRMRHGPGSYGFDIRTAAVWEAPEISTAALDGEERIAILRRVAALIRASHREAGLTSLLASLIGFPDLLQTLTAHDAASVELQRLRQGLEAGQLEVALVAAETFLGLGSGLTPSGDDLLLGLLLALNRWGQHMDVRFDIGRFNQGILIQAARRTTTLSANLLDCAVHGQADERLVAALDGLLTGHPGPETCAAHLIAWGSSSGCDAFVGMALAVLVVSSYPSRSRDAH